MAARGQIHFWAEIYHHGEGEKKAVCRFCCVLISAPVKNFLFFCQAVKF